MHRVLGRPLFLNLALKYSQFTYLRSGRCSRDMGSAPPLVHLQAVQECICQLSTILLTATDHNLRPILRGDNQGTNLPRAGIGALRQLLVGECLQRGVNAWYG